MCRKLYSNCFFALCYLLWRGSARGAVIVSGEPGGLCPFHLVALTRRGHVLHFQHTEEESPYAPLWFAGNMMGISRQRTAEQLSKSGRTVYLRIRGRLTVVAVSAVLVLPLMALVLWKTARRAYERYRARRNNPRHNLGGV